MACSPLSGQVKLGFMAVPSTVPHVKSGRLVPIAVKSPQRLAVLPDVPTVAESGCPVRSPAGVSAT